jgi:hypothetical protein
VTAVIPLACAPGAISASERAAHFLLIKELFGSQRPEERDDGFEFTFPASDVERVARFMANERKCCPFLRIELVSRPGEDQIYLLLSGPPGTRGFLSSELELQRCGCEQ